MSKKTYRVRGKYVDGSGRGVVSFNHSMIPVPGLLPGELAEIELYRKKDETLGRLVTLVERSQQRVDDVCPYGEKCGGCQLWHMSYGEQLKYKQEQVQSLMGSFGKVPETIGMDDPQGYRHKIHGTFGRNSRGQIISGFYEEKSHRLLDMKRCRIQDGVADDIMGAIRDGMKKLGIAPYDEDRRRGMLRHVLIRTGYRTGEIMVVFVLASFRFPQGKALCDQLIRKFPKIRTIVYNLNGGKTSMVLGDDQKVVYGEGYIEDELCGLRFRISPKSFYQVNPEQTEKLYMKAVEMARLTAKDRVLDTYCGIGTISLLVSRYVNQVTGVELNPDAIVDARENAKFNGITNVRFVHRDATRFMEETAAKYLHSSASHSQKQPMAASEAAGAKDRKKDAIDFTDKSYYNVVIMDPPRSGSTPEFLKALVKMAPEKVIYISCNPVTQKRDMGLLIKSGYKVRAIQPVDMFPMTSGIENIVLLERTAK